jgi:hypothetical protein
MDIDGFSEMYDGASFVNRSREMAIQVIDAEYLTCDGYSMDPMNDDRGMDS